MIRRMTRQLAAGCAALALILAGPAGPAAALGEDSGSGNGTGSLDGTITAVARYIHFSGPGYVPGFPGNSGFVFDLPACWYEGGYTWQDLQNLMMLFHHLPQDDRNDFPKWPTDLHYGDDTGTFWTPACTDYSSAAANTYINNHLTNYFIWEPAGQPGPPEAIDPVLLAKADIKVAQLPAVTVSSSPDAGAGHPSFVTLPTWLWAADWGVGTSVTADVPGLTVTVTAKPRVLLVDPGTTSDRATVHANAGIVDGEAACSNLAAATYTGNATAIPPCGVTYTHSTADVGSYQITTKVVWDVTYAVNGVAMGAVPDTPEITTAQTPIPVVVDEVQTPVSSG